MNGKRRGTPPLHINGLRRPGVVILGVGGESRVLTYDDLLLAIGAGDVTGPGSATDNAVARFDGVTGKLLSASPIIAEDDGRFSNVTDPTGAQDAATKAYVDAQVTAGIAASGGSGGHLHGLMRVLGDGATTTFNLVDIAEYVEHIAVAGSIEDPLNVTLSTDGSQIAFASAPGAGAVIALEYVIAGL